MQCGVAKQKLMLRREHRLSLERRQRSLRNQILPLFAVGFTHGYASSARFGAVSIAVDFGQRIKETQTTVL